MPIPADRLGQPDLSEVDVNKIVSYLRPDIEPEDSVESDALIFDAESTPNTMRYMEIWEDIVDVVHESTVGKVGNEDVFHLQNRGLDAEDPKQIIVAGFIEPLSEKLPIEYTIEPDRLIEFEMDGSLG